MFRSEECPDDRRTKCRGVGEKPSALERRLTGREETTRKKTRESECWRGLRTSTSAGSVENECEPRYSERANPETFEDRNSSTAAGARLRSSCFNLCPRVRSCCSPSSWVTAFRRTRLRCGSRIINFFNLIWVLYYFSRKKTRKFACKYFHAIILLGKKNIIIRNEPSSGMIATFCSVEHCYLRTSGSSFPAINGTPEIPCETSVNLILFRLGIVNNILYLLCTVVENRDSEERISYIEKRIKFTIYIFVSYLI